MLTRVLSLAFCCARALSAAAAETPAEQSARGLEFFEKKVRPLLAEHCFECHGPEKQKAHLRLDSPAAIRAGGENGPVIAPGQPEESRLIRAVGYDDEDLKMPPKTRLAPRQVADLAEWVLRGAPMPADENLAPTRGMKPGFQIREEDRAHWSFQPIERPAVPGVKQTDWPANPIDAFILARLEARGLLPNPPAEPRELIRRAYYDLTGLPPSPQEVEAFLSDPSPRAWERLIDRLLDSPRYGEKWGRHWLDLVRFAETNSYERDGDKPHTWRYRDYVIRSLNEDKPFDRFVREQLAGDEMPGLNPDALIATGFYRLGIWDDEPSDRELARYDGLDDIVTTVGQVFLGLTIDCARCHDHKIDPISQKDYYRMLAFFQNIHHYRNGGPTDEVPLFASKVEQAAYESAVQALERKRNDLQADISELEDRFRSRFVAVAEAGFPDLDELEFRFYRDTWDQLPDFDLLKPEETGRVPSKRFDLSLRTRDEAFGFVFAGVLIVPEEGDYVFYLDSDDGSRLSVDGKVVLHYDGIHNLGTEQQAAVRLRQGRLPVRLEYFQQTGDLELRVAWSGPGFERRSLSAREDENSRSTKRLAEKDFNKLMREEGVRLLGPEEFKRYLSLKKELQAVSKQSVPVAEALAVTERGSRAPETFVLLRGNPGSHGPEVEPGFLEVLNWPAPEIPPAPENAKTSGRRTVLANWITSTRNPLTARVMANRIWQYHFGRGLVRSPNDFGRQGDRPTHPELLDWLAAEFVAQGWRMKALHRLVMNSQTYRMSSRGRAEALQTDPANDLFWRYDMRRLTAEEIRDTILAISGVLQLKMYGPSVLVDIPKEVLAGQSQPGKGWGQSPPSEQARRSVYIKVKRSLITPILESYDFAETDRSTPVRFTTVQPTQALGMLNGEFLNQQAAVFARRLQREGGGDLRQQVRLGLYLATSRQPSPVEVDRALRLIETLVQQESTDFSEALKYFCLMTLNLTEAIYLD